MAKVTKELLQELYLDDPYASMSTVAEKLGCNRSTVIKAMRKYGLQGKAPGTRPEKEIPELSDREWLQKQLDTKTMRQLAKELGTSSGRIADRAYRYGLRFKGETRALAVKESLKKRYPEGRRGELASNWQGGRQMSSAGYVKLHVHDHPDANNGYVFEHRLVMEQHLGRRLEQDEIVHHIDGDKTNNKIENLLLTHNGEHIKQHFKDSHQVKQMRSRIAELEAELEAKNKEIAQLKEQLSSL